MSNQPDDIQTMTKDQRQKKFDIYKKSVIAIFGTYTIYLFYDIYCNVM